jgi:arylsulfatase A-like enzyme
MPYLKDAVAKGVRFTQAYVPVPLCAPVRACLASGKEYDDAGIDKNHVNDWPLDQVTFYKLMRDQSDYQIFSCGKDDLYENDANFPFYENLGSEGAIDLGFTNAMRSAGKHRVTKEDPPFEHYRIFLEQTMVGNGTTNETAYDVYKDCFDAVASGIKGSLCTADKFTEEIYPDNFVANVAIQLLSQRELNQPWFMQVNFPGPHAPEASFSCAIG